ncbi:MAG TPA: alanine--glyoxylate aminotransferase family protein [Phycisphaerae bacterium]|nr:alanine--glyoxylate aminotransferase family protein [Phycisphaerae bacterium]HNU45362.1 alanine--glyoxylate aminotransferase family protein [Phycisphaerae bacterium]
MKKLRLFTPGPVMVPEDVMLEMAQPMLHHRTEWYRGVQKEVTELLRYVFQTKSLVLIFTGSGTSAMEGAIVGCLPAGHKALVINNGKFGERWVKVCAAFGIDHTPVKLEWGQGAKPDTVKKAMDADPKIDTVIMVHSETSASAVSDVEGIAKVTRERNALLLVDGITAVGAIPFKMDDWGVDVCVTGSQKALMLPPGLGFAAINDRAWQRIDSGKTHCFYNDVKAYRKSADNNETPYTPAVTLIRGALVSLRKIKTRGLENVWAETKLLGTATRAAVKALGLKLFAADPVDSVTGFWLPQGMDEGALRKTLREKHGMQIAGAQDQIKGKVCRITHMGYVDQYDTLGCIAALEMTLAAMGHKVTLGSAVTAALQVMAEHNPK